MFEIYKKVPNWTKAGLVCLIVGYFVGRNAVPTHTETTTEKTTTTESEKKQEESQSSEETTTKKTGPIIIEREETRPDGTKIKEKIKKGGTLEEQKKKETNSKKTEEKIKIVEIIKEIKVSGPLPTYSIGAHIKTPVDEITSNHLRKELDVTAGYRVYKGFWLEGVISTPMDFKKPSVGVGFRVEF